MTRLTISAVKGLPTPSTESLLKAATSRILTLVQDSVVKKSEQRTIITYTGTSTTDLVKQVKQILQTLIADKTLVEQPTSLADLETLMTNAVHSVTISTYSVTKGAQTVLSIQQYRFGTSPIFAYILSIKFPRI